MISQIVPQVGTGLETLVSNDGPFTWAKWNVIVVNLGGSPRNSFEAVAEEIEGNLDPVFDELDGNISITYLRNNKPSLRILSRKLGINRDDLEVQLLKINGHTLLSTFVEEVRYTQKNPKREPHTHTSVRVASTRVESSSVEKLSTKWMLDHFDGADHIAISAGFYDANFVETLFPINNSIQSVRLLFNGLGGQRLKEQRNELKKLEIDLRKSVQDVEIRLAFAPGLFHTKLFLITENDLTHALVGSANATCAAFGQNEEMARNEEILVALPDAGALVGYFNTAWDGKQTKKLDDISISAKSLIAFFRTGILYFKPVATLSTTINPFIKLLNMMTEAERALLGGIVLPYSKQEASFGAFNFERAVKGISDEYDASELDDEDDEDLFNNETDQVNTRRTSKVSIKPWSVETCFGYWVPSALDDDWLKKLEKVGSKKEKRWKSFHNNLVDVPEVEIVQKYQEYLDAGRNALKVIPTLQDYIKSYNPFDIEIFDKYLLRTLRYLEDETHIERLSRPFASGKMPEIWDDAPAYEDFCSSFFDYLAHVSKPGFRTHAAVPKIILDELSIDESVDGEQLREQFEDYLKKHGWSDDDWR
jgi:HKD family nuclease